MNILAGQLLDLPGYEIIRTYGRKKLTIEAKQRKRPKCIHCGHNKLYIKDKKLRKIQHETFSNRKVFLLLHARKFMCLKCSRYFWERFKGILPYNTKTEPFKKQVAYDAFRGVTKKDSASFHNIGEASVYRYFLYELKRKSKEFKYDIPKVLGIDEHFFTKKKGYSTTICDLRHNRVYDLVLGRSEKALERYFLSLKGREKVQVVCIDLSSSYRSIIKKYFPNAKIVSDRFHVMRLVNWAFLDTWKAIDPTGRGNRGLLSLMRRYKENLSEEQYIKLKQYFNHHPGLEAIYDFKQEIAQLINIKKKTRYQCKPLIRKFLSYIEQLKASNFEPLVKLGKTLENWAEEVVRMWRFTKNNGITEGFHNKMEMLKRRAYGFRNFNNYRLWVKILCH